METRGNEGHEDDGSGLGEVFMNEPEGYDLQV